MDHQLIIIQIIITITIQHKTSFKAMDRGRIINKLKEIGCLPERDAIGVHRQM